MSNETVAAKVVEPVDFVLTLNDASRTRVIQTKPDGTIEDLTPAAPLDKPEEPAGEKEGPADEQTGATGQSTEEAKPDQAPGSLAAPKTEEVVSNAD
jgi:hypothetical protein